MRWRLALVATGISLLIGCARPVQIDAAGIERAAAYPRESYAFNLRSDDEEYFRRRDREGSIRLRFRTRSDLARLADGWDVTSLRYELFDCSNPEIYARGDFFPVAADGDVFQYDAYIPARFSEFAYVAGDGRATRGWPTELAFERGLCFKIEGFNMALLGIRSNTIRVDDLLGYIER